MKDRADVVRRICEKLQRGDADEARRLILTEYPFAPCQPTIRRCTELDALRVFLRDGFIDRYTGSRLAFQPILRLLSWRLPREFPFHANWKMTECHMAYWELVPTIDHIIPVARGGSDDESNWVTTSMVRNSAKANWTLEELGWELRPPGSLAEWDGLVRLFIDWVGADEELRRTEYFGRWHLNALEAMKGR